MADKEVKVETSVEIKTKKVKFISSLWAFEWHYSAGDTAELTPEQYAVAKAYNSIEDV
jgi:hypothetical protein